MTKPGRRPIGVLAHSIALAVVVAWGFHMEPRSHWSCGTCGSTRRISQSRLGPARDLSIPLTRERTRVRETDAARDLLGPGHVHTWSFAQGSDGGGPFTSGVL